MSRQLERTWSTEIQLAHQLCPLVAFTYQADVRCICKKIAFPFCMELLLSFLSAVTTGIPCEIVFLGCGVFVWFSRSKGGAQFPDQHHLHLPHTLSIVASETIRRKQLPCHLCERNSSRQAKSHRKYLEHCVPKGSSARHLGRRSRGEFYVLMVLL